MTTTTERTERAVLVTTIHRGVFFGYTTDTNAEIVESKSVTLRAARNCIYWPPENRGFLGLASDGPASGARIGPPADILLLNLTSAALVTPRAAMRWESAPWK